jgi:hypothetical protein
LVGGVCLGFWGWRGRGGRDAGVCGEVYLVQILDFCYISCKD